MQYRIATDKDREKATELVASTGYYDNVDVCALDGTHYVAVNGDEVVGYVWAITDGRHAFLDLLSVAGQYRNTGFGMRLLRHLKCHLHDNGVRDVRFNIHITNNAALRVAKQFGSLSGYYVLGHAKTGD